MNRPLTVVALAGILTQCVPSTVPAVHAISQCASQPLPESACLAAAELRFEVTHKWYLPERNSLKWRWRSGDALQQIDLGSPDATTVYSLCVYDTRPLDTDFGTDGVADTGAYTYPFDLHAWDAAVQGDGRIVVAGDWWNGSDLDIAVARFNDDGSLDTSFDEDGIALTAVGEHDIAQGIAIQSDGKIVAAAVTRSDLGSDFVVTRYNADGSLDTSFDDDGIVTTDLGGGSDDARDIAIQSDGRILVIGNSVVDGSQDFAIVRYNADGSLDPSFDGDGMVTTDFSMNSDHAEGVAIQADGKIVVGGWNAPGNLVNTFGVARYNPNGSLDTSFGVDGRSVTSIGSNPQPNRASGAWSMALQSDGKIIIAGAAWNSTGYDFGMVRYNADGSRDSDFDGTAS